MRQAKIIPPPATNRGVEKQIERRIDWIECTFKVGVEVHYHPRLSTKKTECKPYNAYNVGVRYEDGRVELHHTTRKEMGVHVTVSGSALHNFPIDPYEYLQHLILVGATITRIDLAIDAKNCNLSPNRANELIKDGKCKTRSRKFPRWNDALAKGDTQYIGTKFSEWYVRIYDKAAELDIDMDWTRVEIVFQGKAAHPAAKAVVKGDDFRALLRGRVDFIGWEEWDNIFVLPPTKATYIPATTNTQKWLLQVAAASLAREIHLSGDDDFYFLFQDAVKVKLEELREKFDGSTTTN